MKCDTHIIWYWLWLVEWCLSTMQNPRAELLQNPVNKKSLSYRSIDAYWEEQQLKRLLLLFCLVLDLTLTETLSWFCYQKQLPVRKIGETSLCDIGNKYSCTTISIWCENRFASVNLRQCPLLLHVPIKSGKALQGCSLWYLCKETVPATR